MGQEESKYTSNLIGRSASRPTNSVSCLIILITSKFWWKYPESKLHDVSRCSTQAVYLPETCSVLFWCIRKSRRWWKARFKASLTCHAFPRVTWLVLQVSKTASGFLQHDVMKHPHLSLPKHYQKCFTTALAKRGITTEHSVLSTQYSVLSTRTTTTATAAATTNYYYYYY